VVIHQFESSLMKAKSYADLWRSLTDGDHDRSKSSSTFHYTLADQVLLYSIIVIKQAPLQKFDLWLEMFAPCLCNKGKSRVEKSSVSVWRWVFGHCRMSRVGVANKRTHLNRSDLCFFELGHLKICETTGQKEI